ncbi:MAG: glycine cleavage system aminomethyltransferase GcvT [Cyclobacteriaceae bacterium]|nr:glycine cleavage system aminomethyltransferase GcvT [Cyclobacteriaceae bacterium]MCH8517583.1 glycine cleavage system aminomethyltransferase GcvT [Cyclobacteriaceae bacterium]
MSIAKKIQLHEEHIALGAKMAPFAGFEMPVKYSSETEEHHTVRNAVGVFDVSHMGEFFVGGPHALELIQKVSSNDASVLVDGQAQYSCLPNDKGGIVDDLIIYRFHAEKYLLVVNASNIEKDWDWISSQNTMGASLRNASDDYSLFAVQGPKAIEAMQSISPLDLSQIEFYHFAVGEFAGIQDVIISGTGYTGSGGFEIYVKNEDALVVWKSILQAGKEFGIQPIGLAARDSLRLEMGYCLYGNDIDDTTSPIEAGLGWITKFTKDFVNAEALKAEKEAGSKRKLCGFVLEERGIPRHGYEILNEDNEPIGVVTSGTQSPILGKGIGMGYINAPYHKKGTAIKIAIRKKQIPATVQRPPFVTK